MNRIHMHLFKQRHEFLNTETKTQLKLKGHHLFTKQMSARRVKMCACVQVYLIVAP